MKLKYPIKLWLLSITLGPTLLFVWGLWDSNSRIATDDLAILLIIFVVGAILSIPALTISYPTYTLLSGRGFTNRTVELAVCGISLLGVWLTFLILLGTEAFDWKGNRSGLIYSSFYSGSVILSALGIRFFGKRKNFSFGLTSKGAQT